MYIEPPTLKRLKAQVQQAQQSNVRAKPLPSTLKRIESMQKRLELMLEIVQKDLAHAKCLQEHRNKKIYERCFQKTLHSKRLSDARAQRYFQDYELQQKLKLQKARTEEEQIFAKAFKRGLKAREICEKVCTGQITKSNL